MVELLEGQATQVRFLIVTHSYHMSFYEFAEKQDWWYINFPKLGKKHMKTIHEMNEKVKQFNAYYEARLNYKNKAQEAFLTLSQFKNKKIAIENKQKIKLLSKDFNEMLIEELDSLRKKMNKDLISEKALIFIEVVKFVWTHPDKKKKLIIDKTIENINYQDTAVFKFSGELGELFVSIATFKKVNASLFYSKNLNVELNSDMSYREAQKLIVDNFSVGS